MCVLGQVMGYFKQDYISADQTGLSDWYSIHVVFSDEADMFLF